MSPLLRRTLAGTPIRTHDGRFAGEPWIPGAAAVLTAALAAGALHLSEAWASSPPPAAAPGEITLTLRFAPEEVTITPDGDHDLVRLAGGAVPEAGELPGSPALPLVRVAVLLPEGSAVTGVAAAGSEPWIIPRGHPASGGPGGPGRPGAPAAPSPGRLDAEWSTGWMRGYAIGTVLLSPLEAIDAATGDLRLHRRVDLRVAFGAAPPDIAAEVRHRAPSRARDTLERREIAWLRRSVANPADLERFYGGRAATPGAPGAEAARPFAGFRPTPFPSADGPPVEYVIVTDSVAADGRAVGDLPAEFQRLADWKTAKGTTAVVRTMSAVRARYPGHDDAARLRAFLIEAYELWGTDYVLLGGDLRIVPGRRFNGLNLGTGHPPADVYFGGLDSSWDRDRDGVYGETIADATAVDPLWDIWVGRAPVENRAEAAIFVDKSLSYARAPGADLTGLDPGYYERALLMEGLANCATWGLGCNGIYVGEVLHRRTFPPTFERTRLYQRLLDPNPSCAYHETYVETTDSVQVQWTTGAALSFLNAGSGFVHHYEHSNPYEEGGSSGGYGCAATSGGALGREYIDQLSNKPNWSVVYSTGAGVHAFDYESVSEHWVLNPNGGAAAYVGKTRSGSASQTTGEVDTLLFGGIFQDGMAIGQALGTATQGVLLSPLTAVSSFGLVGDPELAPWTSAPGALALAVTPPEFTPGEQLVTVTVRDAASQAAVAGARVALAQGDRAYARALTAADGTARFGVTLPTRDPVAITATAHDYAPAQAALAASPAAATQVAYLRHSVADDSTGVANANGVPDAGEVLKLDVTIENTGLVPAAGVTGELACVGAVVIEATIDGLCQPGLVFAGAMDGHPPAGGSGCVLRFPEDEFGGVSPRGRPAAHSSTNGAGLFVWRDGDLWRLVARGAPAAPGMRFAGGFRIPGGHAGAAAGALEGGDVFAPAGADSIAFDFTAQAAGDQDSLSFTAREVLWVSVPDPDGAFGDLPPGGTAASRFLVAFSNAIPDRHEPRFELALRTAGGGGADAGRTSLTIAAAAPDLAQVRQAAAMIGSAGTLAPVVRNAGSGVADLVRGVLRLESGAAAITDSIVVFGAMAGNSEAGTEPDRFAFTTPDTAGVRFQVVLENTFPDGTRRIWTRSGIDITRPCPPGDLLVEPTEGRSARLKWTAPAAGCAPDLAGYNIYRRLASESQLALVAGADPDSTQSFQDGSLLPDTTWVYAVAARDSSGNESALSNLAAATTWAPERPGWPRPTDAGTPSSPLAVDVDGDGRAEIFALGNSVYAWRADGAPLLAGSPDGVFFRPPRPPGSMSQGATGAFLSSPAAADLDGDGSIEIVVSAWDDSVWVLDAATGALRWGRHCVPKYSSPALGDLDGDGELEIVVGSDRDTVYAWRADGAPLLPGNPTGAFAALPDRAIINYTTPALADIDADPATVEVIYATFRGNVYAWDGSGALLWASDVGPNRPLSSPALGDVDHDGVIEVVVTQGNVSTGPAANALYVISAADGAVERAWAGTAAIPGLVYTPGNYIHPPSLADLDGDGDLEILLGTSGLYLPQGGPRPGGAAVLAFDPGGGGAGFALACTDTIPVPGLNMTNTSGENVNAQPVAADLDGDAGQDVAAGSTTFGLFMFDIGAAAQDCTKEPGWPLLLGGEIDATPSVGDVDRDGRFDLVVRSHDGEVHVFDLGTAFVAGAIEWGQFLHDPRHTSNYATPVASGGSLPGPGPAAPARLALAQNAPNPFRPPTRIAYEVAARGRARLDIFAVDGRFVRALVDRVEEPGPHEAAWDGRDALGAELPAGVYFCRLEAGGRSAARKLLLVK